MFGGELIFHFVNVMLLTVVIAPLILWRYRRAVLAGMQDRGGAALPLAPVAPTRTERRASAAQDSSAAALLAWEARVRRRIFVAVLAALAPSALLLAAQTLALGGQPLTPAHVFADRRRDAEHGGADLRRADGDAVLARAAALARHAVSPWPCSTCCCRCCSGRSTAGRRRSTRR